MTTKTSRDRSACVDCAIIRNTPRARARDVLHTSSTHMPNSPAFTGELGMAAVPVSSARVTS